jgi:LysM repeat protein
MLRTRFAGAIGLFAFQAAAAVAAAAVVAGGLDAQALLRGSQASVERMYSFAVAHDFDFHSTAASVRSAASGGGLVALSSSTADYELHNVQYPYVMPAVKVFVERLAGQYRASCKQKLVVTSAARPTNMRVRNASDLSVHSTGMAVDLRSTNIAFACRTWLRKTLESLERAGVVEATEERKVPHFHVAVYPAPYNNYVAQLRRAEAIASVASSETDAASADQDAGSSDPQTAPYEVRIGDSLWRIATRHDTSVQALQDLNRLRSSTIHPGQVLIVPVSNRNQPRNH